MNNYQIEIFRKKIELSGELIWLEDMLDNRFRFSSNMLEVIKEIPNNNIQIKVKEYEDYFSN